MKFTLTVLVIASLLTGYACFPYQKPMRNNIGKVAFQLLDMLSGECQMYNYTDTITRPGCEPVQVVNKFCGGKCISRYYPGFAYCTACMPRKLVTKRVFFNCPSDPEKKIRHRNIQIVQDCECRRFLCSI